MGSGAATPKATSTQSGGVTTNINSLSELGSLGFWDKLSLIGGNNPAVGLLNKGVESYTSLSTADKQIDGYKYAWGANVDMTGIVADMNKYMADVNKDVAISGQQFQLEAMGLQLKYSRMINNDNNKTTVEIEKIRDMSSRFRGSYDYGTPAQTYAIV